LSPAINNRLTQYAENLAGEYQNGVRIIELVLTMSVMHQIPAKCYDYNIDCIFYTLLVSIVFDTVSREKGLQRSQEIGMLSKLIKTSN
jgi:hypothetical protein